ncbi:hypothetical protein F511_04515 [Dorcoceras hygrometricum]|uniref:DNA mismatch repair proteins mutS family domain-containing protein n=1 Tax=Dorcoceras hygrometricum TaxID=472368 RepID=A0A2Z7CF51_9LAMI|nr:hypothetical protein F511_04515 [Dorcoceras hygrometricum]
MLHLHHFHAQNSSVSQLLSLDFPSNNYRDLRRRRCHSIQSTRPQNSSQSPKQVFVVAAVSGSSCLCTDRPSVLTDSLTVLQWDRLCDCVASFAGTSIGKEATKKQLWNLDRTFEDSMRLLQETNAAVEMHKYGAMIDFTGLDVSSVQAAIRCAHRGSPVSGSEALALLALLKLAEMLQLNIKAANKEDSDWYARFMPLSAMIVELVINPSLIRFIEQLIDEDGSVKDSASSDLRQARDRVRVLERKEVSNINGRWCIKSEGDMHPAFEGLLLSSNVGAGNLVEPLAAVPLNDELQQARLSVTKAETDVLLKITKKMQVDLVDIQHLCNCMTQIDLINARARYSISFDGSFPDLYMPCDEHGSVDMETSVEGKKISKESPLTQKKWTLYLPKAYHPLLLLQHRQNLQKALKDLSNAKSEISRKNKQGGYAKWKESISMDVSSLEMQVSKLKQAPPIPFDIFVEQNNKVLVITGPNTGGKTICLKTVGLAAMMAKSGLYVLASEPARIPWFDFVFADIGDEQSLTQSLSTFSGHLKQISEIKSLSTHLSLVLLDEVGAGTNPLEGASLGMSLLESFADCGALLTIATTHHGELKTLKYSNDAFENACMEFDEVNLKPTYRILWGVPGRSNAINIAERLGMPAEILDNARELYGAASAEINEVIVDMERFKQEYHEQIREVQLYLRLSKELHQRLQVTQNRVMEHVMEQRQRMIQEILEAAATARSVINRKARESRSNTTLSSLQREANKDIQTSIVNNHHSTTEEKVSAAAIKAPTEENATSRTTEIPCSSENTRHLVTERKLELPKIGDTVNVPSLNKKATVMQLDSSKGDITVQAGNLKLKLKLSDITT